MVVPIEDLIFVICTLLGGGLLLVTVLVDDILGGVLDALHVGFDIGGVSLMPLLLGFVSMFGVGGLMGLAVATSCLLGMVVNFFVLAPIMIQAGDIAPRIAPNGATVALSRIEIVNQWSLWWGVTMMVVGAIVSLVGRPEIILSAFRRKAPGATSGQYSQPRNA